MAPQLTTTKGFSLRLPLWWRIRATSSLPVPFSPVMRTVLETWAARSTTASTSCMAALMAMKFSRWKRTPARAPQRQVLPHEELVLPPDLLVPAALLDRQGHELGEAFEEFAIRLAECLRAARVVEVDRPDHLAAAVERDAEDGTKPEVEDALGERVGSEGASAMRRLPPLRATRSTARRLYPKARSRVSGSSTPYSTTGTSDPDSARSNTPRSAPSCSTASAMACRVSSVRSVREARSFPTERRRSLVGRPGRLWADAAQPPHLEPERPLPQAMVPEPPAGLDRLGEPLLDRCLGSASPSSSERCEIDRGRRPLGRCRERGERGQRLGSQLQSRRHPAGDELDLGREE